MKANKSFGKRFKVTKNGKLRTWGNALNHFRSKQSGEEQMGHKRERDFSYPISKKKLSRYLGGKKK